MGLTIYIRGHQFTSQKLFDQRTTELQDKNRSFPDNSKTPNNNLRCRRPSRNRSHQVHTQHNITSNFSNRTHELQLQSRPPFLRLMPATLAHPHNRQSLRSHNVWSHQGNPFKYFLHFILIIDFTKWSKISLKGPSTLLQLK